MSTSHFLTFPNHFPHPKNQKHTHLVSSSSPFNIFMKQCESAWSCMAEPWPSPQQSTIRLNFPLPLSTKFLVYLQEGHRWVGGTKKAGQTNARREINNVECFKRSRNGVVSYNFALLGRTGPPVHFPVCGLCKKIETDSILYRVCVVYVIVCCCLSNGPVFFYRRWICCFFVYNRLLLFRFGMCW